MQPLYIIKGVVIKGKERGRRLGFPTANIKLDKNIPDGIYISEVFISDKNYKATTFVGIAKTFHETKYFLESYILDFNEIIYGKEITVKLYEKIRKNIKFASEELLIAQIKNDVEYTRRFFSLHQ